MIELHPYQDCWPQEFVAIGALLRRALGPLALRVDHIGSTSVPGLASKDVIDVQLTVHTFDNFEIIERQLIEVGFVMRPAVISDHRPNDNSPAGSFEYDPEWEKRYFRESPGSRRTHIHVRAAGRSNQRYAFLFRDYLRAHPKSARAYEALKFRLAECVGDNHTAYPETKDPVCDLILFAAESWASAIGWTPGPSDV